MTTLFVLPVSWHLSSALPSQPNYNKKAMNACTIMTMKMHCGDIEY